MHLLDERDLGHSMSYYDRKLEKKKQLKIKKAQRPAGFEPSTSRFSYYFQKYVTSWTKRGSLLNNELV